MITKLLSLDQMRMGQRRNNSTGKKTIKENLFNRQYSVALINLILAIFIINMEDQTTQK